MDNVVSSTIQNDNLSGKLATITLASDTGSRTFPLFLYKCSSLQLYVIPTVPPPSSETELWWETAEHRGGVVPLSFDDTTRSGNPWDSDSPLSASPSSSDEELFNTAFDIQPPSIQTRKPPPPPPPRKLASAS